MFKPSTIRAAFTYLSLAGVLAAASASASADQIHPTHWQKAHPRRAEVNQRIDNQNRRIRNEVREGEMSPQRAARLHKEERQIRREERVMASQNGGHITKQEQLVLNQQENALSKRIGH